jgi:hypothetical protein
MERVKKYRVRRLSPTKFRIVNPNGDWVENDQGNASNYGTYRAAIRALRRYEKGRRKEPHPLLDFGDMQ